MKKLLLAAAAISLSGVAVAQDAQQQGTQPAQDTQATQGTQPAQDTQATQPTQGTATDQATQTATQPSGQTVDDPSQATGPQGVTQQGTDPGGQATAPAGVNQAPPADAGTTVPAPGQQAAFTPRPAAGEYPPCSRTVTDSCVQTYERGVRRGRPRR